MQQTVYSIPSTLDGTQQPSLFYKNEQPARPLLVGLHTWSYDRFNQIKNMLPLAEQYGFNLLLPEFRGPNLKTNPNRTQACAAPEAKQDIKDAIDYTLEKNDIDRDNIFLLGGSGGGHMALMMAGFCPEYFKAIAAFVPICNLNHWARENEKYKEHILACCSDSETEMAKRSPVNYIDSIAKANLKIFHGKYDPVVPVSQSFDFYTEILQKYPKSRVFLDIFDGGHQLDTDAAMTWLLSQYSGHDKTEFTG